jgi:hypothetical protein
VPNDDDDDDDDDKTVIQGATDLMQQPELCNELFTPYFL